MLYWSMPNVLYVEGHALDRFAEGLWALKPVHQNKVCSSSFLLMFHHLLMIRYYVPTVNSINPCFLPCDSILSFFCKLGGIGS